MGFIRVKKKKKTVMNVSSGGNIYSNELKV
jgi:hypothetical protein